MFPPTKRLNYFDHQFLRVDDFSDEQAYHLGMRRAHNRLLHAPGVAQGLAVTHRGSTLTVSPGVALDGDGREIVLREPVELDAPPDAEAAWITIAYGERRIEPTTETGAAGDRRWEESPVVQVDAEPPDEPETRLVLARVSLAGGRVTGVDDGEAPLHRRVAGPAPGAELEVRSLAVQGRASVGGTLRVEQALWVNDRLEVGQTLSLGGAEGGATLNLPGGRADGDLRVGRGSNRLDVGVEVEGAAAGTARLRAEGADPRLVLGAGASDVLTVRPGGVEIEAASTAGVALKVSGALDATELRQNGVPVVGLQWAPAEGGIAYTEGRVGIGTAAPTHTLHLLGPDNVALFESTGGHSFIGLSTSSGLENRVEFVNRGDRAAIWVPHVNLPGYGGDALNVLPGTGEVVVPGELAAGSLQVSGGAEVTGTVGIGTSSPTHPLHVTTAAGNVALFQSTGKEAYIRVSVGSDIEERVEFCNRGGFATIWVPKVGDAVRVYNTGNVQVTGRLSDAKLRREVVSHDKVTLVGKAKEWFYWADLEGMTLTLEVPAVATFLVRFQMGGVQVTNVDHGHAGFRLLLNDAQQAWTEADFHSRDGWDLRGVTLERLLTLEPGRHTLKVQWFVASPESSLFSNWAQGVGCHHGDTRTLIAIEL